jgi:hypothetical protein
MWPPISQEIQCWGGYLIFLIISGSGFLENNNNNNSRRIQEHHLVVTLGSGFFKERAVFTR